ncbi:MAG: N-acetylneuraminate synthase family protein [Dehalococcoidia bacterium]|nr:N-acetylneuraminate synthase family protein [Dehalococcoidia bacterium]
MKTIKINNKMIAEESPPFLIAEAGVNYYDIAKERNISPLEAAKLMVIEAAEAGADAIKFQTYKADKLAVRSSPAYWDTTKESVDSQYELFKKYDSFWEDEYRELAGCAKAHNIIFMSTPFDEEAVDLLTELVPVFKISSSDITNIPFIKHVAKRGKPIFLSTGASTIEEIRDAVCAIESEGNREIVVMHCVLNYPTHYQHANLLAIRHLRNMFPEYIIGYSDHVLPDTQMLVLTTAYLLGARVIEKHFTLNKSLPGNDHYHAMEPQDLRIAVGNLQFMMEILGSGEKDIQNEIQARMYARRSVVAKVDIAQGTKIIQDLVTCKRPGTGISPKLLGSIIGKTATRNIKADEILSWEELA